MELVNITCPNGHAVSGHADYVGKSVRCPKCKSVFVFELPSTQKLTETAILRLLGDGPKQSASDQPTTSDQPSTAGHKRCRTRHCPRCHKSISVDANVCNHCDCYVGKMPQFLQRMIRDHDRDSSRHN